VKRVTFEGLDTGNTRQLRYMQRARASADILRGEFVAAIGFDEPA
jgi:hypothetical protein